MRYCTNCRKLTAGSPPYCNHCGRSYQYKLCPRGHQNPRAANACSTCGSHELSTPSPQTGMSTVGYLIGTLILFALSVYALYFAYRLLTDPNALLGLMRVGIELGVVLLLWMMLFGKGKTKR